MKTCHAVFSNKAAKQYGYAVYEDVSGKEVYVTATGSDREHLLESEKYLWPDAIYVGKVVKCVGGEYRYN
jgi:hypothetical protein